MGALKAEAFASRAFQMYVRIHTRYHVHFTHLSQFYGIAHFGPVIVHLSPVPAGQDVRVYDGSGEWLKISTIGIKLSEEHFNGNQWLPWNGARLTARLPKQVPAGQYLLRVDQIWPGDDNREAQHYPACAQIEVESDFVGKLPAGVKIPEGLSRDMPG